MSSTTTESKPLLVPAAAAARMLGISRSTFWTWVREEKAPAPVKLNGLTRWRVADLERLVEEATVQPQ